MSLSIWSGRHREIASTFSISGLRDVWSNHFRRIDDTVEFSLGDKAQLQSRGLECEILVHGVVSDFRSLVVTDDGRECRYQHQRTFDIFINLFQIRLGALDQEPAEVHATVAHDRYRMHDIEDHHWLVDVHLEVSTGAAEAHGN